jgi:hypothetical protein
MREIEVVFHIPVLPRKCLRHLPADDPSCDHEPTPHEVFIAFCNYIGMPCPN